MALPISAFSHFRIFAFSHFRIIGISHSRVFSISLLPRGAKGKGQRANGREKRKLRNCSGRLSTVACPQGGYKGGKRTQHK
jgi:hypothetical protein